MSPRMAQSGSSYPPLLLAESDQRPTLPYFDLPTDQQQPISPSTDRGSSPDRIQYDGKTQSPSAAQIPFTGRSYQRHHVVPPAPSSSLFVFSGEELRSSGSDEEGSIDGSQAPLPSGESSSMETRSKLQSQILSRGKSRGRGRGRGRGRPSLKPRQEVTEDGDQDQARPRKRVKMDVRAADEERQPGAGRGRRGPKAPVEPSSDFKNLLSKANSEYIAENYDSALHHAGRAIQVNPEIFAAHNLVSEIYRVVGNEEKSLEFLFSGAHTRRESGVWWQVAHRTETSSVMSEEVRQERLMYCYSRILEIDKDDYHARKAKLTAHLDHEHYGNAIRDCRALLKIRPNDLETLQILAEVSVEAGEVWAAKEAYEDTIASLRATYPSGPGDRFTFSDLNIYLELFAHLRQYVEGLATLKSVARWLCGRRNEIFWDAQQSDDGEWDLEDEPRRINVPGFQPGVNPPDAYGSGLPFEIRAKFGIFRLRLGATYFGEAMNHLMLLEPGNDSAAAPVLEYPDLFRDVGDALYSSKCFAEALQFYEPLLKTQRGTERGMRRRIAEAYRRLSKHNLAIVVYESLLEERPNDADCLVELARIYEDMGDNSKAMDYVWQVITMGKRHVVKRANLKTVLPDSKQQRDKARRLAGAWEGDAEDDSEYLSSDSEHIDSDAESDVDEPTPRKRRQRIAGHRARGARTSYLERSQPDARLTSIYQRMKILQPAMRDEEEAAVAEWMECAEVLLEDFKSMSIFFPNDRYLKFLGYSRDAQTRAVSMKPGRPPTAIEMMANRLQASLEQEEYGNEPILVDETAGIPKQYRGISFEEWLEIFCEYSFCAARGGQASKAYDWIKVAKDANVFLNDSERMSYINTVLFVCALLLEDEECVCVTARWFMKTYPAITDCYRLYVLLNRLLPGEPNWYHSGPSQKFILRHIKLMDFAVLDSDEHRRRFNLENWDRHGGASQALLSTTTKSHDVSTPRSKEDRDETAGDAAKSYGITSLDPALLTMYGNLLSMSGSQRSALNYYLRAYALDPDNAMIMFSISVAYLQLGIKRQAENRHYAFMQALGFFDEYKQLRLRGSASNGADAEPVVSDAPNGSTGMAQSVDRPEAERNRLSEVEYNQGRLYHFLGLTHLAIAAYERCLAIDMPVGNGVTTHGGDAVSLTRNDADEREDDDESAFGEEPDFKREAAFALQQIYAIAGDFDKAQEVTDKWLVY